VGSKLVDGDSEVDRTPTSQDDGAARITIAAWVAANSKLDPKLVSCAVSTNHAITRHV
jgi:DNA-binding helix-hairpin-helix protein with protein kinase domain